MTFLVSSIYTQTKKYEDEILVLDEAHIFLNVI